MVNRKNNSPSGLDGERTSAAGDQSFDSTRVNDEENLDTRLVSSEVEEGDEDYDDEELTEADFAVDELDEEDSEDEED